MKSVFLILILSSLLINSTINSYNLFGQSKAEIQNVDFELINNETFIITYDIVNYSENETFNVSVSIYTASDKKIEANSFEGDVNNNVTGGKNKKIIWYFERDIISLDEDIYIEVSSKPEFIQKTADASKPVKKVSTGKCIFLSAIYPGWGNYKIKQKIPYLALGAIAYGSIAAALICNNTAAQDYEFYQDEDNIEQRNFYYDSAVNNQNISRILGILAAGLWITDIYLVIKQSKRINSVSLGYIYNPDLDKPLLSVKISF